MDITITGTDIKIEQLEAIPECPGLPPEWRTEPADALKVPMSLMGITNPMIANRAIFARFSKVVKPASNGGLFIREPVMGKHFISSSAEDLLRNPATHPRKPGMDRYQWYTDADGVEYGFLIEGHQ